MVQDGVPISKDDTIAGKNPSPAHLKVSLIQGGKSSKECKRSSNEPGAVQEVEACSYINSTAKQSDIDVRGTNMIAL
jgi:NADPH-dependent glutamate synthase beta subunit-like oxidoreductase